MKLDVLYCCDDGYAPFLGVSMTSLLENNRDAEAITVYIVCDHVSDENIARFRRQAAGYGSTRNVVIIDGEPYVRQLEQLHMVTYRGGYAYALRLFFTKYIARDTKRLLYLDCDTIICGSLRALVSMPMEQAPAAAVLDSLSGYYKRLIGFAMEKPYFNSGVILFDVENWNRFGAEEIIQSMLCDPKYHFPNPDQDVLNLMLAGHFLVLPPKYNFQVTHKVYSDKTFFSVYPRQAYYSPQIIQTSREQPVILHTYRFLGQFPWHRNTLHPWRTLFWQYAAVSEWADLQPLESKGGIFAVERMLFRMMPKRLFLRILERVQDHTFRKIEQTIRRRTEVLK